jgi:ubiquinol-cytochrome c reductase cytochrome c subunit
MTSFNKYCGASVVALLGSFAFAGMAQAQTDANVGHDLFMKRGCYLCHGTVGQGSAAGPTLAPDTMPLAAMMVFVRTPANQMPPFTKELLSDADLGKIHAYLSSIPKSASPDSIPLLPKFEMK